MEPEGAATGPVKGEAEAIEKVFPFVIEPVIELVEFTVPCTVSLAVPPPLAAVP
jgi:hypothetical protein